MRHAIAAALVAGILAGCGSAGATPPAAPDGMPGAGSTPERLDGPTPTPPVSFPFEAFASLGAEPVPAEVAARLQAALEETVPDGGIAATVLTPQGAWTGVSGTEDGERPVSPTTQFGIASVTKPIVAAQVMRMVEAGEIDLDAPATDSLPGDLGFDTNGATVRQLLSHRSGIPEWYEGENEQRLIDDRDRTWTQEEVLGLVDPARGPLDRFAYADTNYTVLGLLIEQVRGRPLAEVLRGDVLRVEGTDRLVYQPGEAPSEPMAMPAGESRTALEQGKGFLPSLADASADGPAGSGASDTPSLAHWWRALCAGEVVSRDSLIEMATLYENGEIDYGLGLFDPLYQQRIAPAVGHLGGSFGYKASAGCVPEHGVVFAVLTNQADVDSQALGWRLVQAAIAD